MLGGDHLQNVRRCPHLVQNIQRTFHLPIEVLGFHPEPRAAIGTRYAAHLRIAQLVSAHHVAKISGNIAPYIGLTVIAPQVFRQRLGVILHPQVDGQVLVKQHRLKDVSIHQAQPLRVVLIGVEPIVPHFLREGALHQRVDLGDVFRAMSECSFRAIKV